MPRTEYDKKAKELEAAENQLRQLEERHKEELEEIDLLSTKAKVDESVLAHFQEAQASVRQRSEFIEEAHQKRQTELETRRRKFQGVKVEVLPGELKTKHKEKLEGTLTGLRGLPDEERKAAVAEIDSVIQSENNRIIADREHNAYGSIGSEAQETELPLISQFLTEEAEIAVLPSRFSGMAALKDGNGRERINSLIAEYNRETGGRFGFDSLDAVNAANTANTVNKGKDAASVKERIKKLIQDANSADGGKKLPETFTALSKLKGAERIAAETGINALIASDGVLSFLEIKSLKDYYAVADAAKPKEAVERIIAKKKDETALTKKRIKTLISAENKKRAGLNKDIDAMDEALKKAADEEAYRKQAADGAAAFKSEYDKSIKKARSEFRSADTERAFFEYGSRVLNLGADKLRVATGVLCEAQVKSELAAKEAKKKEILAKKKLIEDAMEALNKAEVTAGSESLTAVTSTSVQTIHDRAAIDEKRLDQQRALEKVSRSLVEINIDIEESRIKQEADLESVRKRVFGTAATVNPEEKSEDRTAAAVQQEIADIERQAAGTVQMDSEEPRLTVNIRDRERMFHEARELTNNKQFQEQLEVIEAAGNAIQAMFTEENMSRIDTAVAAVEKIAALASHIMGKGSGSGEAGGVDIQGSLDSNIERLKGMLEPEPQSGHVVDKVVNMAVLANTVVQQLTDRVETQVMEKRAEAARKGLVADYLLRQQETVGARLEAVAAGATEHGVSERGDGEKRPDIFDVLVELEEEEYVLQTEKVKKDKELAELALEEAEARKSADESALQLAESAAEVRSTELVGMAKDISRMREELHEARGKLITEAKYKPVSPVIISENEISAETPAGIAMISRISGVPVTEQSHPAEIRMALKKIYINGITADQFLELDKTGEAVNHDPAEMKKRFTEIGNYFRDHIHSSFTGNPDVKNPLNGQIIAVENEDFLLSPILLENEAVKGLSERPKKPQEPTKPEKPEKNYGFFDFSGRRAYRASMEKYEEDMGLYTAESQAYTEHMEQYGRAMEVYNENKPLFHANSTSRRMCEDFNKLRIEAAEAEYGEAGIEALSAEDKKLNARRLVSDKAVRVSREEVQRSEKPQRLENAERSVKSGEEKTEPKKEGPGLGR